MDYIRTETDGQLALTQTTECLHFPSGLHGFHNTATTKKRAESGRNVFCFHGLLDIPEEERTCRCGARMHINGHPTITLRHLCIGGNLSCLMFPHNVTGHPDLKYSRKNLKAVDFFRQDLR